MSEIQMARDRAQQSGRDYWETPRSVTAERDMAIKGNALETPFSSV